MNSAATATIDGFDLSAPEFWAQGTLVDVLMSGLN